MRTRRTVVAGLALGAGLAVVAGQSAAAHVSIAEGEAEAGAFTLLTFGVPHGCEGSPTTEVRIQMPESIPQVTPTVNPNWEVEKVMTALDEPIEAGHGELITERVSEVVYTATTPLADGFRDAFVLSLQVPEDAAGETLYFPTIQTSAEGETAWIELPADGEDGAELASPAPSIVVVEASDDGGDDSGDDGSSNALAIAGLVAGLGGLGLGAVALTRRR